MELYSIDDLELYIDEEVERKGKTYVTRKPLLRDLEIGEVAYLKNTNNKIIKQANNTYTFHRFDDINTHVEIQHSGFTLEDVKDRINKKLDYELKYADDRVKLVNSLLESDYWLASLLSTTKMISKEHKKKKSFLAENQSYDKLIDLVNDYMYHAKFKNEKDEKYFESLVERNRQLSKKRHKSEEEQKELYEVNGIISEYNNRIFTKNPEEELTKKQSIEKNKKLLNGESFNYEESREVIRKRYKQQHPFDITFWDRMSYNQEQKSWRNELINTYEQTLERLKKQLGYDKKIEERKLIQEELLKTFKTLTFHTDGLEIKITPKRQLKILNDQYAHLKSDFKVTIEKLTNQFTFKRIDKTSTEYCWSDNTWYEHDGEVVELSNNIINYSNPKFYEGMLQNYYELKDKYFDKMNDDMWAILHDFEDYLQQSNLSYEEQVVCEMLMNDKDINDIAYSLEFDDKRKLYRMIDTYIPNKLRDTYIRLVDEWLYTERLKGNWKQCSKCGEIKLISNDRYFHKEPKGKDGFKNTCKTCIE